MVAKSRGTPTTGRRNLGSSYIAKSATRSATHQLEQLGQLAIRDWALLAQLRKMLSPLLFGHQVENGKQPYFIRL